MEEVTISVPKKWLGYLIDAVQEGIELVEMPPEAHVSFLSWCESAREEAEEVGA